MLHITEDTPADMLSGAMDLTIHLPSGKPTKMCVERSTPMMDLLVQITTNHQLQITNYTLQPLQTTPDNSYSDKILSYYPNTPIGALDTQHVRIVPKTRTLPVQKSVPVGHQPFESTFRLKVHLPRNQLYVTRVSRHVHIGDIMRKVCEEKNLDPNKCEVRHPGNLDEVLDPKLTLNDYMITEIYLILKGSTAHTQTFSANDIMTLRKEEERKHIQSKTGGGVFNLIFRRGKTNSGSGSTSTRGGNSISPPHSEDSRSVTPPVPPVKLVPPAKTETQPEKPRVPQRKRRPAPKPPKPVETLPQNNNPAEEKVSSIISDNSAASDICVKNETNVMICHSRHSSDSSGYHETSILSEHCNTSLPRRNVVAEGDRAGKSLNRHSQSIGNLTKMAEHSRSTSSLAFAGRKKKAAPPPPKPLQDSSSSKPTTQKPSPVVASQISVSYSQSNTEKNTPLQGTQNIINPPPVPRRRKGPVPIPRPRSEITQNRNKEFGDDLKTISNLELTNESNYDSIHSCPYHDGEIISKNLVDDSRPPSHMSTTDILKSLEYLNLDDHGNIIRPPEVIAVLPKMDQQMMQGAAETNEFLERRPFKLNLVDNNLDDDNTSLDTELPAMDYLTSLESDISYTHSSAIEKQIGDDFSVTSLTSFQDVHFKTSGMKRWGSWEKLNQPPTPPSSSPPLEELFDDSTQETIDLQHVVLPQLGNLCKDNVNVPTNFVEADDVKLEQDTINISDEKSIPAELSVFKDVEILSPKESGEFIDHMSLEEDEIKTMKIYSEDLTSNKNGYPGKIVDSKNISNSLLDSNKNREDICYDDISLESERRKTMVENDSKDLTSNRHPEEMDNSENVMNNLMVSNTIEGVIGGEQSHTESLSTVGLQSIHNELDSEETKENTQEATITARKVGQVGDNTVTMEKISSQSYTDLTMSEQYLSEIDKYIDYRKSPQDSGNSSDISEKSKLDEELSNEVLIASIQQENDEFETEEWQLPSPPKAFKDSASDSLSEQPETSVTVPVISQELLDKLRYIEEQQVEHIDQMEETNPLNDNSSTISEDRPLLSNLSLENLEKRQSLVYNRELATSLKLNFDAGSNHSLRRDYQSDLELSKTLNHFEKTLEDIRNANQQDFESKKKMQSSISESTLPNFKITTYDEPKQKIKVFEDETIHSNSDYTVKSTNFNESQLLQENSIDRSMENISVLQSNSEEVVFRKQSDVVNRLLRPQSEQYRRSVNRSGSFSTDQNEWSPSRPVMRSKSQVAYKREEISRNSFQSDNLSKSSSLFDVSGLQSLEVMRKIQNKLNTPTASTETITKTESAKEAEVAPRKVKYLGPPSINMGTWSERPKVPVSVKEDEDYKLGQGTNKSHSSVMINSSIEPSLGTSVKIKHTTSDSLYGFPNKTESKNVTIKINGTEPISTEKNGNVLIKIGQPNNKFKEFNTDILYRQPLNSLNKNSTRPHSVAFSSDFDISRVPVVRSVELKKSFKDTSNNSSTNISDNSKVSYLRNGYSAFSKYSSNENLTKNNYSTEVTTKPVFRAKSFLQPVVKGFRNFDNTNGVNDELNKSKNRYSWQPSSSMTLPSNVSVKQTYITNQNVPFSKLNLRKTDSKKLIEDERTDLSQNSINQTTTNTKSETDSKYQKSNENSSQQHCNKDYITNGYEKFRLETMVPPPPPQMPKVVNKKICNRQFVPVVDPRDELLKSIRDFGGKKGLRSRKA